MHIVERDKCACLHILLGRGADVTIPYMSGRHIGQTVLEVLNPTHPREAAMVREAAERQTCPQPVLK